MQSLQLYPRNHFSYKLNATFFKKTSTKITRGKWTSIIIYGSEFNAAALKHATAVAKRSRSLPAGRVIAKARRTNLRAHLNVLIVASGSFAQSIAGINRRAATFAFCVHLILSQLELHYGLLNLNL